MESNSGEGVGHHVYILAGFCREFNSGHNIFCIYSCIYTYIYIHYK